MQIANNIHPSQRYLLCTYSLTEKLIKTIKTEVTNFMANRAKDNCYHNFMNWQRKSYELAVLTMYAYDDIPLPTSFDTIFQIQNPATCSHSEILITHAIYNGWVPLNQISRGHKHVLVLQFKNTIPSIFDVLPIFGKHPSTHEIQLGFCKTPDYEEIKRKLLN